MAGKFLSRNAIIDTLKSERRANAIRKRLGLTRHPIDATSCGCPDENCGAYHTIRTDKIIPTPEEAIVLLNENSKVRKSIRRRMSKSSKHT